MNSYKLNGIVGHLSRQAIIKGLGIAPTKIYKVVKDINDDGTIILHDNRKFKLKLEELK